MKRTQWRRKPSQKPNLARRKKKMRMRGISDTSVIKEQIQATLRQIVMLRDKRCILFGIKCLHEVGMDGIVWQAEHLIERSNSATYADTRLVVLVCKNCHGWKHFKKSNHDQYDEMVRNKLSKERIAHWDKCKKNSWRPSKVDWKMELVALKQELSTLTSNANDNKI